MNFLTLLRIKHSKKLNKLISNNVPYDKVLRQSQILDKYIVKEFKLIHKIK